VDASMQNDGCMLLSLPSAHIFCSSIDEAIPVILRTDFFCLNPCYCSHVTF
jgi:hypothetical protein